MELREKIAAILGEHYCVGPKAYDDLVYPAADAILGLLIENGIDVPMTDEQLAKRLKDEPALLEALLDENSSPSARLTVASERAPQQDLSHLAWIGHPGVNLNRKP